MTLNELKIKADKDMKIDASALDMKSLQIPYITSSWLKDLNIEALTFKRMITEHEQLRSQRYHYFKTSYSVTLKTSSEINEYLKGDEKLKESSLKLSYQEEKVKYVENVVKTLNQMSFNISNAIKWNMFQNGG